MVAPVIEATLYSLARDRLNRLGGIPSVSLADLAREYREGAGDAGICFEYAVHHAIDTKNPLIYDLASEVLENFCSIRGGVESLLFGPEKDGVIPVIETVNDALTDDSVVFVGNRGRPPRLKKYIPKIVSAFRRSEERNNLPRSIQGIWKADLFLGNPGPDQWVGTTVKINPQHLQGSRGLRIGIYPKMRHRNDVPRKDDELNLVRLPLPYDSDFMELFYKSFFLVRAFLRADAKVPRPVELPDAEDRYVTQELESRRDYSATEVIDVIRGMAQPGLLENAGVQELQVGAELSDQGLENEPKPAEGSPYVSLTPIAQTE